MPYEVKTVNMRKAALLYGKRNPDYEEMNVNVI
jgi:hypothetical protein